MDDATSGAGHHTPAGCCSLHPPLERFTWHFSTSFTVALIMDISLFIIMQILLLKGNYLTKAELKEWQLPAKGMMLISHPSWVLSKDNCSDSKTLSICVPSEMILNKHWSFSSGLTEATVSLFYCFKNSLYDSSKRHVFVSFLPS